MEHGAAVRSSSRYSCSFSACRYQSRNTQLERLPTVATCKSGPARKYTGHVSRLTRHRILRRVISRILMLLLAMARVLYTGVRPG